MADAQAVTLDDVFARGGNVDQQIDEVVFQQVDLIDVEEAAVGLGQEAGLERFLAPRQGLLKVEGADDAVLGGAQRQVDDGHRLRARGMLGTTAGGAGRAIGSRVAAVGAALHNFDGRQQGRQPANNRGLAGTAVAKRQHAADPRINCGQHQGELQFVLANEGGEREGCGHRRCSGR